MEPAAPSPSTTSIENPYPFLASLDKLPKEQRPEALRAYVASRELPAQFGPAELELEHAFGMMLGRPVSRQQGTYVAVLSASLDVVGELEFLAQNHRPRIEALRAFEPEIDVSSRDGAARALLLGVIEASQLDARRVDDGHFIVVRGAAGIVGRVTSDELREVADELEPMVFGVTIAAPSDGSLFDALRYMLQQEDESWGMSDVLSPYDMIVDAVDARMKPALDAIENRDLATELASFCDRDGRSARAWRWKGKNVKDPDRGVQLTFVAGIYDGEGVGMDFDIYRVEKLGAND